MDLTLPLWCCTCASLFVCVSLWNISVCVVPDPSPFPLPLPFSPKSSTALFFKHNTSLGPPYQILIDTNFINFSITNKLDIFKGLMDLLLAKCIPIITDCVMAELEKLGTSVRTEEYITPTYAPPRCTHSLLVDLRTRHY